MMKVDLPQQKIARFCQFCHPSKEKICAMENLSQIFFGCEVRVEGSSQLYINKGCKLDFLRPILVVNDEQIGKSSTLDGSIN